MHHGPTYHKITELPQVFPVFPLTGALLLPRGHLPLNIFEPRYLNMVDDALSGDRLIGMIQPTDSPVNPEKPELYPVGCLGRLSAFTETPDGRYLITLTGICRFRVAEELETTTPYRQVSGNFEPYTDDIHLTPQQDISNRDQLIEMLQRFLDQKGMETDWESVHDAPGELLVNSLAMTCPFSAQEKQALLEAASLDDRIRVLMTLLEMAVTPNADGSNTPLQ